MRLNTVAGLHLSDLKRRVNHKTVQQRRYILEAFIAHLGGDMAVKAVGRKHVEDWAFSQEVAPGTLRMRFNVIRGLFRFAQDRRWISHLPTDGIILPRVPRRQPRALTYQDLMALDRVLPDARSRLIIALGINEGLRRVEIARLELSDVDTLNMTLRVLTAKSGTEDSIPLTADTFGWLKAYMPDRGNVPGPLIQSQRGRGGITADAIGNMAAKWMKAAGIKGAAFDGTSLHACRHTMAMNMLAHGAPIETISIGLRHADLSSTFTYLRPVRNVEAMRPWMGHRLKEAG